MFLRSFLKSKPETGGYVKTRSGSGRLRISLQSKLMVLKKIFSLGLVWCLLLGAVSPACTRKSTSLSKKTKSFQRNQRSGKGIPCPTKDC
ncbi:hypothetical protein DC20_04860 [Rufibacter tibetensis]|uniref:Uncharacterized protein n=1 Tax=Rufibacter tibetensis TaxID=512763 RepID=A0A0P0C0U5_9BACT|nr:hypothetical protein DC20_04860 [Rufibacter tibetensis]